MTPRPVSNPRRKCGPSFGRTGVQSPTVSSHATPSDLTEVSCGPSSEFGDGGLFSVERSDRGVRGGEVYPPNPTPAPSKPRPQ